MKWFISGLAIVVNLAMLEAIWQHRLLIAALLFVIQILLTALADKGR